MSRIKLSDSGGNTDAPHRPPMARSLLLRRQTFEFRASESFYARRVLRTTYVNDVGAGKRAIGERLWMLEQYTKNRCGKRPWRSLGGFERAKTSHFIIIIDVIVVFFVDFYYRCRCFFLGLWVIINGDIDNCLVANKMLLLSSVFCFSSFIFR